MRLHPPGGNVPSLRLSGLHLVVLSSFAFAQPLFDLLGRNGEFFAARGSSRGEIVVLALALTLCPPALLLAAEALAGAASIRARATLHVAFVAGLVGAIVLQALRRADGVPGQLLVVLAAGVGLAAAVFYFRSSVGRAVVTALAPAPLLFVALFLAYSDAAKLIRVGEAEARVADVRAAAPVVFVLLDEFPLASVLDGRRNIDAVRYPHTAELAGGATWFRSTTTVAEGTLHAVPAVLTGRHPRAGSLPRHADHPQSLFTLLGRSHAMRVFESETHLCPPELCPASGESFGARTRSLAADVGAVYLHLLLPQDLAGGIPSVSNGWRDFWGTTEGGDQIHRFRRFLEALTPSDRPALYFIHVLLPHSPWQYLPSGRRYAIRQSPGWNAREVWTTNDAGVLQFWQRHLLQVGLVDRLLGELTARLRKTGLYDRSLLVVAADHGISFRAGEKRRPASAANLADLAYVPFLLKEPGQQRGRLVADPVRTIDVLPSIADALGVRIPWRVDGRSALAARRPPPRDVVVVKDGGERLVASAGRLAARHDAALARQLAAFGSGEPLSTVYAIGRYRALLGRRLAAMTVGPPEGRVELDRIELSNPTQVSGRVRAAGRAQDVAVVVGGRVAAVAPVAEKRFWALVPGPAFMSGGEVRIFTVAGNPRSPSMRELARS